MDSHKLWHVYLPPVPLNRLYLASLAAPAPRGLHRPVQRGSVVTSSRPLNPPNVHHGPLLFVAPVLFWLHPSRLPVASGTRGDKLRAPPRLKTTTPSQAELHPRGRCYVVRRPNCRGWLKCYDHPGPITNTSDNDSIWHLPRSLSSSFWEPYRRGWQCRLQPSLRASALSTLCTSLLRLVAQTPGPPGWIQRARGRDL